MSIGKFRRLPLHIRATLLFPVIPEGTCEFRRLVQFILVGAVYNNALTNCATRVCCACKDETAGVAVMYLTLRISRERHGRKNPLPYSFSERSHVGNLRQAIQGKGRSSKRKGNRRCPFLFAHRRGRGESPRSAERNSLAESQRKTSRPLGANTLTQFAHPSQPVQRKEPPVRGEPACGSSSTPLSRCRERSRPLGANTLTQFECPGQPVQKRSRPEGSAGKGAALSQ